MKQAEVKKRFLAIFEQEIMDLREEGHKEYAHEEDNAFANFERTAAEVDISRERVLWIFAMKHKDGIAAYLKGHTSQREDVRGRINDLIVYLFLLRCMVEENMEGQKEALLHEIDKSEPLKPMLGGYK